MKKKTIAIILSFSMALTAAAGGVAPQRAGAESSEPASGSVIETETTQAPVQSPEISAETETPSQTPEISTEPESPSQTPELAGETEIPSQTPAATVTPAAVNTPAPAGTTTPAGITSSAALKVGEKFSSGNLEYSVIAEGNGDVKAAAKVIGLSETGKTKTSVTIPATVTTQNVTYLVSGIKEKSFKNNKKLTTVKIGKNVTYIGRYAFQGMTSLSSLTMGSGVTEIRKYAFAGCKSLRKVTITAKTKFIGEKAFQNCKKLKAVIVNSKKINTIKSNAFRYVKSGCYMVVPSGKKNTYRSLLLGAKASKIKLYVY